jgi:hypothetical protein
MLRRLLDNAAFRGGSYKARYFPNRSRDLARQAGSQRVNTYEILGRERRKKGRGSFGSRMLEVGCIKRRLAEHDRKVRRRLKPQTAQNVYKKGDGRGVLLRAWGADDLDTGLE